jgi:hypothetical protein
LVHFLINYLSDQSAKQSTKHAQNARRSVTLHKYADQDRQQKTTTTTTTTTTEHGVQNALQNREKRWQT